MDDDNQRDLITRMAAQISALTAAFAGKLTPPGLGDGSLSKLRELYEDTVPAAATWRHSLHASMTPAILHFGDRPARTIAKQDWTFFRDHVRSKQITLMKRRPEPTTMNHEMARWRITHHWAVSQGLLHENPLVGIKPLKAKKHRQTEPNDADLEALRPLCDPELWAYVLLGYRRGLRGPSEARKLEWKNVDLERGHIKFTSAKSREPAALRIPSDIVEALRAIRPDVPGRYVFQSPMYTGSYVDATTLWRRFRIAADAAKLEPAEGDRRVVFHDTRHGFTSGMARKVPLAVAMRMSRHKSLRSASRYIHVNDADLEDAYEKLEKASRKPPKSAEPQEPKVTNADRKVTKG